MFTRLTRLVATLVLMATLVAAKTTVHDWNNVKALRAGTTVRVTAGSATVRGEIDRVTDDTLVVSSGKDRQILDRKLIMRVSVEVKGPTGRNTLIGLGVGAGVGFGIGAAISGDEPLIGSMVLTPVGAAIGALAGSLKTSRGWRVIYKK